MVGQPIALRLRSAEFFAPYLVVALVSRKCLILFCFMKERSAFMRKAFWTVCLALTCLPLALFGQGGFGLIAGKVVDPSGAVIAAAKVTATNVATNVKFESLTSGTGEYQLLRLPPGKYDLAAEMPGFKTLKRSGIVVQVDDRLIIDLSLEVGEVTQTVEVASEAPLLRTSDAQLGEVVTNKMITNLPQLNRDPLQLLRLSGNIQGDGSRAGGDNDQETSDTRINGGRTAGVEYLVDGATIGTGRAHHVARIAPTMEAVGEFKVVTNGLSAEYGRFSGGVVELVTNSGTNAIHGQAFDYIQNDILNANSWNQNRLGGPKTPFRRNNFGVAVGGPVWIPGLYKGENKTFFFFNYDGIRYTKSGQLNTADSLTEAERNGDFSQRVINGLRLGDPNPDDPDHPLLLLYDAAGRTTKDSNGNIVRLDLLGGDGKHIPADRIHPVSTAILKMFPLPNRTTPTGENNYIAPQDEGSHSNGFAVKIDQYLSANHKFFGRFAYSKSLFFNTQWRGPLSNAFSDEYPGGYDIKFNYDWTISPTFLLNARVGGFFNPIDRGNSFGSGFDNSFIPFNPVIKNILGKEGMAWVGDSSQADGKWYADSPGLAKSHSTTFNPSVSMVKILTKHTLKFGYEHRRYYDNYFNTGGGQFVFQQNHVNRLAIDNAWNASDNVRSPASFLLGYFSWGGVTGNTARSMAQNYHAAYIQDDFKVSSKLTLNLGLRWDMETPTTERYDRLYVWDPDAPSEFHINPGWTWEGALKDAGFTDSQISGIPKPDWVTKGLPKGAIRVAGSPEHPSRNATDYKPTQFAPRVGAAYQITDKTIFRASFGQIYMSTTGDPNGLSRTGPTGTVLADTADTGWHANQFGARLDVGTWENPFLPNMINHYRRDTAFVNKQATGNLVAWNSQSHQPWELVWSAGITRELPHNMVFEATYNANRGMDLLASDMFSRFPKQLFKPENRSTYVTRVNSPFAGQVIGSNLAEDNPPLAILMFQSPYYGLSVAQGSNIGKSQFHALNLRAERRFSRGWGFLANYTLSRLKDDAGGPEAAYATGSTGVGSHDFQSVDTLQDIYGISPLDETHRLTFMYQLDIPIGKGRRLLGKTDTLDKKILDYVVGGWEFAGISQFRSGRPIQLGSSGVNVNNDVRVEVTWPSATGDIKNSAFQGGGSAFRSADDSLTGAIPIFDKSKTTDPQQFTYGNLNPLQPGIRHPGRWNDDISLMKRFTFTSDGRVYLQVRAEAFNVFNRMQLDQYDTNMGSVRFGLVTQAIPNTERRMQLSARLVW
jgi:hypothetical protein